MWIKLTCLVAAALVYGSAVATTVDVSLVSASDAKYKTDREAFVQARDAIRRGDDDRARQIRKGISKDYPLNIWLDYYSLSVNPDTSKFKSVIKFINDKKHTELSRILQDKYIEYLSVKGEYKKVNVLMPTKPFLEKDAIYNFQKSKLCRFYESKWHLSQATEDALAYGRSLYLSLREMPYGCSAFMGLIKSKGYITDKIALEKFERAYVERRYESITKELSESLMQTKYAQRISKHMAFYDDPLSIFTDLDNKNADDRRVAVLAFQRYANVGKDDARDYLERFIKKFSPTQVELVAIKKTIANNCLARSRPLDDVKWVDANLPAVAWSNELKEQRLRRAVYFSQWDIVYQLLEHMPSNFQEQINWQYWKGISAQKLGYKKQGLEILKKVAKQRDFFGFLAAQKLNLPYAYNHLKLDNNASWAALVKNNMAVRRFFELEAIGDSNASVEWSELAKSSSNNDALLMGQWALQTGNIRYAIDMVVKSGRWDALSYRFPIPYLEIYKKEARSNNVALSFLYGISRQESMLNATIRSPVGAVGLMQLMPGTAKFVAKKNKWKYKGVSSLTNPEVNIKYGSYYIKDMLGKFDNNRVLAACAYNAGPGRVPQWLSKDGKKRSVDVFVESIPFLETRKYVQNVILYDAIYNYLLTGKKGHLLRKHELNYRY